jgi:branched-chain amino acid transport system ATP-binding protein
VNNIEVVYNDVILVLRGLSLAGAAGPRSSALLGANGRRQVDHAEGDFRPAEGRGGRGDPRRDPASAASAASTAPTRTRSSASGIFQVMEGRRIVADMTCLENLRLGAFTRTDHRR